MLFNSIDFFIFLPLVFCLHWIFSKRKYQNAVLLIASYVFYGWWNYKFLGLIFISSLIDFIIGNKIYCSSSHFKRKLYLSMSIISNIGVLFIFKYFNFFLNSFVQSFTLLGYPIELAQINIILPVGISFYTFQTLGYSIDIYKYKIQPIKNSITFFTYISFFPQLVAGPIERAINLLPQFSKARYFKYEFAVMGLRQILFGFFKKVVIADSCAIFVDKIFSFPSDFSASTLLIASILFSFQIYCDFSGYSDIAIGTGRLFGITLMKNFALPYFSSNIVEFWRRWHISLSTWFRDYIYIPLGGSKLGIMIKLRNIFIVFLLSGLWHGANLTFILWGVFHAILYICYTLLVKKSPFVKIKKERVVIIRFFNTINIIITFLFVSLGWIIFRSETVYKSFLIYKKIFSENIFIKPILPSSALLIFIFFMLLCEWVNRKKESGIEFDFIRYPKYFNYALYSILIFSIVIFGKVQKSFIYFQF